LIFITFHQTTFHDTALYFFFTFSDIFIIITLFPSRISLRLYLFRFSFFFLIVSFHFSRYFFTSFYFHHAQYLLISSFMLSAWFLHHFHHFWLLSLFLSNIDWWLRDYFLSFHFFFFFFLWRRHFSLRQTTEIALPSLFRLMRYH